MKLVEDTLDWSFRHILCWIPEAAPASPSPLEDDEGIEIVGRMPGQRVVSLSVADVSLPVRLKSR